MLYLLLKAVHVLGLVLWVGGMAFAHFFLRPSLAVLDLPAQRLKLMHAVLQRFFAAVLVATALIVASGFWMAGSAAWLAARGGAASDWPLDWLVMAALGLSMVAIFGHIRFVLFKRLGVAVAAADWPAGGMALAAIRRWVSVNLALGAGLILFVYLF
jgi:uncharacterized membrane protein